MYSILQALRYINYHKKIYFLFCIQITMIVSIAILISSLADSLNKEIQSLDDKKQIDIVYLMGQNQSGEHYNQYNIEFVKKLEKRFPTVEFALSKGGNIGFNTGASSDDDVSRKSVSIFEVYGDFGNLAISNNKINEVSGVIYVPEYFLEKAEETLRLYPNFYTFLGYRIVAVSLAEKTIQLDSGEVVQTRPVEELSNSENSEIVFEAGIRIKDFLEKTDTLDGVVVAPLEMNINIDPLIGTSLGMKLKKADGALLTDILYYLNEALPGNTFSYESMRQKMAEENLTITLLTRSILTLASICLGIVLVGLSGFLATIIERRKFNISLSIVSGSTKKKMRFELFLEIYLITLFSVLMGIILAYIIQMLSPTFNGIHYVIDIKVVLIILGIQALLSVLLTLLLGKKYLNLNPITVLNGG